MKWNFLLQDFLAYFEDKSARKYCHNVTFESFTAGPKPYIPHNDYCFSNTVFSTLPTSESIISFGTFKMLYNYTL